jgi:hypothetical protein
MLDNMLDANIEENNHKNHTKILYFNYTFYITKPLYYIQCQMNNLYVHIIYLN